MLLWLLLLLLIIFYFLSARLLLLLFFLLLRFSASVVDVAGFLCSVFFFIYSVFLFPLNSIASTDCWGALHQDTSSSTACNDDGGQQLARILRSKPLLVPLLRIQCDYSFQLNREAKKIKINAIRSSGSRCSSSRHLARNQQQNQKEKILNEIPYKTAVPSVMCTNSIQGYITHIHS